MFYNILIIVGVALAIFLVIVAFSPADFKITRTANMSAMEDTIFEQVNDFHNWENWSPWAKMDPTMQQAYEGAPAGKGAIYTWLGNKKVGQGKMTIMDSKPGKSVLIKLEFLKPFKATNMAEFTFKPMGNQTAVNWTMSGNKNFIFKAVCMFMDMDKVVGADFEKGLAAMKAHVESTPV